MSGKLYIVPTPIGNLKDITLRALEVLSNADLILAEDTRVSSKLLKHYEIETGMRSYHQFNEHKILPQIIEWLKSGKNLALISDAGTPAISDPGFLLVREALAHGMEVETLPGATAFVPALINSGLPAGRFVFEGFLPVKKGRKTRLEQLADETRTMIFYEAPHRLVKTLRQFEEVFGEERRAAVAREMTKKFEETKRGTLRELANYFDTHPPKGELVIVVEGKPKQKR